MTVSRRGFLKKGLLGGAILAGGGTVALLAAPGKRTQHANGKLAALSPYEYAIFGAAAARLAPGDGAADWPTAEALHTADRLDALLAELHPGAIRDFKRLLHVFESALTGLTATGTLLPFTRCTPAQQDRRLEAWRHGRVELFRSGYQAMKRLAHALYYSSPQSYERVGYPGPPVVPKDRYEHSESRPDPRRAPGTGPRRRVRLRHRGQRRRRQHRRRRAGRIRRAA